MFVIALRRDIPRRPKTAEAVSYPAGVLTLAWLADEDAQMISCALYMLGDLMYGVGSVLFFPQLYSTPAKGNDYHEMLDLDTGNVMEIGHVAEIPAVVLFVVGSVVFVVGALLDLMVLLRSNKREGGGVGEASGLVKK